MGINRDISVLIDEKSYLLVKYPLSMLAMDEMIVVGVSFAASALLNQIPYVKKYLV